MRLRISLKWMFVLVAVTAAVVAYPARVNLVERQKVERVKELSRFGCLSLPSSCKVNDQAPHVWQFDRPKSADVGCIVLFKKAASAAEV